MGDRNGGGCAGRLATRNPFAVLGLGFLKVFGFCVACDLAGTVFFPSASATSGLALLAWELVGSMQRMPTWNGELQAIDKTRIGLDAKP